MKNRVEPPNRGFTTLLKIDPKVKLNSTRKLYSKSDCSSLCRVRISSSLVSPQVSGRRTRRSRAPMTYQRFLRWRGISDPRNPVLYLTRRVINCGFEPGFHRFWQKWNPPVAFLAYRLYAALRRSRSLKTAAAILAFTAIGLAHDIVKMVVIGRFTLKGALVFLFFGGFTVLSRSLQSILRQLR